MVVVRPEDFVWVDPDDFTPNRKPRPSERAAARPNNFAPPNPDDRTAGRSPPLAESVVTDPYYYTLGIGQSKTIRIETIPNNLQALWTSRNPGIAAVDKTGKLTGIKSGSTVINARFNDSVIDIAVAVVPGPYPDIHYIPKNQETYVTMDNNTRFTPRTTRLTDYKTEPTSRLAYRFVNPKDIRGASGTNGGIDILSRGPDDTWMWTTYCQGGFFYDLNGFQHIMTDGVQRDSNGVVLTVDPSFVYINGVPYLQLKHTLKNTGNRPVSRQRFGAGADIMIHTNDHAPITINDYGVLMTDINDDAIKSMNLRFIGKAGPGITPVSTLWIGPWEQGNHLNHVYDDGIAPGYSTGRDSAMAFSYQNIALNPGESKSFIVRFTLARNSN
ncbi:MAG: Ig-like domain-containing protein [Spirochaetaceae bacterium]|nr:Ig-like domain-containing protein [Spirochaetaceae bacterium]